MAEVSALYVDTGTGDGSQPGEAYEITGRRSITIYSHNRVSLGTYFNAFPASYWQRWTPVRDVRLVARFKGRGLISVYKSSARGRLTAVASKSFVDETVNFDLPVRTFVDGGYYWFDVACGRDQAELLEAEWQAPMIEGFTPGSTAVGITTFDRPSYCLNQIRTVGEDVEIHDVINRLIVVDQGSDLVEDQPGFAAAAARLGEKLMVARQPNFGGSGGFSRTMLETLETDSRYVLLLDDDAISEPESIARAVRFADFARDPIIVGGGMLHLDERAVLYTQGEVWDPNKSWMQASSGTEYDHDFAVDTLRGTPELHRLVHADFNGWWMCLIPTAVLREVGLSMPAFLKFDDIEFALRAASRGFRTVCLPGVAVWHMAWHDKDPTRTWEEYFIHRNRIVTGLLHSHVTHGGHLPLHSFLGDVKLLFMLQYSTVRLRHQALQDVFAGPEKFSDWLGSRQADIRRLRSQFTDAQVIQDIDRLPPIRRSSRALMGGSRRPTNPLSALFLSIRVAFRQLLVKESTASRENPERVIAAPDIAWWRFADIDSALVTAPDGSGVAWYQRDRATMRAYLFRSVRLTFKLYWRWNALAAQYQRAMPNQSSVCAWRHIFERGAHAGADDRV